nr:putative mitochondrial protein [Tanacetum cinerariifolium]
MVNTRNNNLVLNTPPPTDPVQAALAAIQETLANIQAEVRTHSTEIASLKRREGTSHWLTDELTIQPRSHLEPNNTPYGKLIRIEFLKFSGDDVKDWIYRCKQFFKMDGVPDRRKIQLASMHMFDAALVWYQHYVKKYPDNTPWEHFEVEVVKRFGVLYDDLIVELKNLKQTGSVQTYQEAFEALLNRVDLLKLIAVSMFMGGLKPKVGTPMRMFQATTLSETYGLARMQEATNTILKPRYNTPLLPTPKQSTTTYVSKVVTTPVKSNSVGQSSGYVTRNGDCVGDMVGVTDSPQITLNALFGLNSYQPIRVRGRVGKQVVHILIDYGSTHNFLDIHSAKKLGCRLAKTTPMQVSVANGQRMMSTSVCHDFKWSLQNEVFTSDVMLLPLGGCEMVLGIQWLATLRDMQCNFKKLIMKFNHKGKQLVLRGMNNTHLCQMKSVGSVSAEVEQVLTQFDEVFEVPKDLPPQISHDHQIPFMPNSHPINEDDICKTAFKTHEGHYEFLVMPFGLTNAPSTFQNLMNTVFKAFLRKFVLVFFDDILIYSKNLEEHCDHLAQVLQVMKDNTLYAKRTKCYFAVPQVEYLGHIISAQGVSTYPSKIEAMQKWPIPSTIKQLRGFLGLTGYYRRFIKDYASISQPLVALTKKDAFEWNPSAEVAYHVLKEAMVKAPVLALPNFEQEFVVETMQVAKELKQLVAALDKWKGYLLDRYFKIRTDHFSLKYLLNQKLTTPFQFKWLPKLLGYDYEIVYKKGSENMVADALSRMDSSRELLQIFVSSVSSGVWDKRKEKVVVRNDLELRKELVQHFHDEAVGGHSGAHVTIKKLESLFYWKGIKKMVNQIIRDCNVCQRQKPDLSAYPGLIQSLIIPERIWKEISMDFIKKLPKSHGKSMILVVVDKLSKYAYFISLTHPFTASQVAQVFLDQVYKLHGLPESITEVVNRSLGCYLRCMCGEKPKEWVKWLSLAEFWYNTNYHTSTKTTPYEVVYCQTPHIHVPYIPGDSRVKIVDRTLQAREEAIKVLKFHLRRSQDRMRNQANKHMTDR